MTARHSLTQQGASNTKPARLPALGDIASPGFLAAVKERLEVREGERGNPWERAVTFRDLQDLGVVTNQFNFGGQAQGVIAVGPGGQQVVMDNDSFANAILGTRAFKRLLTRLDDPSRFDYLPQEVRAFVSESIASKAQDIGADIRRIEQKHQSDVRSLALRVDEFTAAASGAVAGVRETTFAVAEAGKATAGKITQVEARLDDFDGLGAAVEEVMSATADRVEGLAAEYYVKVQAGNKVAGFSLAASEDPTGASESAFIVLSDKFAVVGSSDTIADPLNPPSNRVPFGIDAVNNVIYLNGQVRINAGGMQVQDIGKRLQLLSSSYMFQVSAAGSPTPSSVTLTANLLNGLSGTVTWTVTSGTATLTGSGSTRSLAYADLGSAAATIQASVTDNGITYSDKVTIAKATDGSTGTAGTRGSLTLYRDVSASSYSTNSWTDQEAYAAVLAATGSLTPVLMDTVTEYNNSAGFSATKYWAGSAWNTIGVYINGNLLVTGTVAASALAANQIFAEHKFRAAAGVGSGWSPNGYGFEVDGGTAYIFTLHSQSAIFSNSLNPGTSALTSFTGDGAAAVVGASTSGLDLSANGTGYVGMKNVSGAPGAAADGVLYVQSGALKFRGSSGTVTTLAPA